MEKDFGRIKKNDNTDIVIRIDDFGGRVGLTIREYTLSDRYTGFTKSGTRIPAESFKDFKKMINSINESDLEMPEGTQPDKNQQEPKKEQQKISEKKPEKKQKAKEVVEEDTNEKESENIEEELF